jgi:hypothetical protein
MVRRGQFLLHLLNQCNEAKMNPVKKIGKVFKSTVMDQSEAQAGSSVIGVVLVIIGLICLL